jgi:hypothetical protein
VEKVDTVDKVGDAVGDRDEVKCTGLRATGGGAFFDVELVVEVERRRSEVGGGLNVVEVAAELSCKEAWERFLASAETDPVGLKGGGSLRVPLVELPFEFRGFGGGGGTDELTCPRGVGIRGTVTQSGSSVGVYGFDGRLGFGIMPFCGGLISDRAGCPLSSHHFLLSELAGGSPASIESYSIKSSSSVSSFCALAVFVPTSN